MKCRYCKNNLKLVLDLSDIEISVTSDCSIANEGIKIYRCKSCGLIQKESSQEKQIRLFNQFISHNISGGEEQVKFVDGLRYTRSDLIMKELSNSFKVRGSLLDVGTGNGTFLKSFQKLFPYWELFGQDIQDNSIDDVTKIISKENFFCKDISLIDKNFDLIMVNHVIGHVVEIKEFIDALNDKVINSKGQVIVQTPYVIDNIFDLFIIDQINHFSKTTLLKIFSEKFNNINIVTPLNKELTLLTNSKHNFLLDENQIKLEEETLDKNIKRIEKFIRYLYNANEDYVAFGTAPVSTYFGGILGKRLICFIDEDTNRAGKQLLGKNILLPDKLIIDSKVILPFIQPNLITLLKNKFKHLNFLCVDDI